MHKLLATSFRGAHTLSNDIKYNFSTRCVFIQIQLHVTCVHHAPGRTILSILFTPSGLLAQCAEYFLQSSFAENFSILNLCQLYILLFSQCLRKYVYISTYIRIYCAQYERKKNSWKEENPSELHQIHFSQTSHGAAAAVAAIQHA